MLSKGKIIYPQRGEIYLVNFDPTIGSEIKKTRPALILQNGIIPNVQIYFYLT